MAHGNAQQILAAALTNLSSRGISLDKILVQKFMYFLESQGIHSGLRYVPFTYGPFSFELAEVLDEMVFWDNITCQNNTYNVNDLESYMDDKINKIVGSALEKFALATGGDYHFQSMEITGTVLYCINALIAVGEEVNSDNVLRDFKEWKGTKYTDQQITEAFDRLFPLISSNLPS